VIRTIVVKKKGTPPKYAQKNRRLITNHLISANVGRLWWISEDMRLGLEAVVDWWGNEERVKKTKN